MQDHRETVHPPVLPTLSAEPDLGQGKTSRETEEIKHVFVCGMPRSGTTILAKEIAGLANCTGLENTGVMMDEGQYLQDVYPTEWACGGAGRFGFASQSHLTENSPLLTSANASRLRRSWETYWDRNKTIRVEKTPGNLLKTRFLQAAFPNAHFIVVKRHPVPVCLATQKWSVTPLHELFQHWLRCHEIFDGDKKRLEHVYELSYEDYIQNPKKYLEEIASFIGTEFSGSIGAEAADGYNKKYFNRWAQMLQTSVFKSYYRSVAREYERRFAEHGYSLAPQSSKTAKSLDQDNAAPRTLTPLLYMGANIFVALWRASRELRTRLHHAAHGSAPERSATPGQSTGRLRILLLAPEANPEGICGPLLSYCEAEALAQLHDVTLVIRSSGEEPVRRRQGSLHCVEVIRQPWLDRIYPWSVRRIFKSNYNNKALTVFNYPFAIAFEWGAWRRMRTRIVGGEFDVVLRLLPVPAVLPSPFAFFLRNRPIPFVIGPISGGLPWPQTFSQADSQKQWISGLRDLYRFMPFARSTYRHATAIIAGTSQTYAEFAAYREKLFFLLENGVSSSLCSGAERSLERNDKLELIFVGGLVPAKACDLALRAAASLLRTGLAHFTVVGDGPERDRLERLTRSLGIEEAVSFYGWLSHTEAMQRLSLADVLVFPSIRDNSPAVVFEALAAGAVPVVVDFGGPGDTVQSEIGFKVPLTNESEVVSQMEEILARLAQDRELLDRLRRQGMSYARECLVWDAKAQILTRIMLWALRRGPKPNLPPPKIVDLKPVSWPVHGKGVTASGPDR